MAGFRSRDAEPFDLHVVPYPAVTMAIDLGRGELALGDAGGALRRTSIVAGVAPEDFHVRGRDIEGLQVRLSPVVAHAVFGPDVPASGGQPLALDDLWGRDAERLQEQLREVPSWAERFAIAEGALVRRLAAGRRVDREITFAWAEVVGSRGQVRVEHLAEELGWSRKRLWSRFRSQVGLTPKHAAQLVRFDHAAHLLAAGRSAATVAAETGFVDQSHLHRDVMAFAGVTPIAVATAPWLAVDDIAWAAP
jgi:AraC-like DNA-binding protein